MNTLALSNQITFQDNSYSVLKRLKVKYPRMYPMRNIKFTTHRHVRKLMKEELDEQLNSLTIH